MQGQWVQAVVLVVACGQGASHPSDEVPARATPRSRPDPEPAADAVVAAGDAIPADAAPPSVPIIDAPMAWSTQRAELTLAYRRRHSDPSADGIEIVPRAIVLHYTGGGAAKNTRSYFDNVRIEAERKDLAAAGAVNVSAHFVVDRDGTIYQLQPVTRFARHCIGLNHLAIGIENAADGDLGSHGRYPLTEAQVAADVALVRYLARSYPITHLLGHYEVMKFHDHAYYLERDPKYVNDKPDPGPVFLSRVRAELSELGLHGL